MDGRDSDTTDVGIYVQQAIYFQQPEIVNLQFGFDDK